MCSTQGKYRGIGAVNNLCEYWLFNVEWIYERGSRTTSRTSGQIIMYLILSLDI